MLISLIAVPYANDVARWGSANGPRAWLAAGLAEALAALHPDEMTPKEALEAIYRLKGLGGN